MTTKEQTLTTVQTFLGAMGKRDLNTITELFATSVDWYIPGDEKLAPWLGKRSSRDEVRDFFSMLWAVTEPLSAQVDHVFVDGDRAVVTGEFSTKMLATGRVLDSMFYIHITVDNGLIKRYRLLEDSLALHQVLKV